MLNNMGKDFRLTLQSNLVPLQTLHSLLEEFIPASRLARNIVLFPLHRYFCSVENLLDRVGDFFADTVAWDKCDSVFACLYQLNPQTSVPANRRI